MTLEQNRLFLMCPLFCVVDVVIMVGVIITTLFLQKMSWLTKQSVCVIKVIPVSNVMLKFFDVKSVRGLNVFPEELWIARYVIFSEPSEVFTIANLPKGSYIWYQLQNLGISL